MSGVCSEVALLGMADGFAEDVDSVVTGGADVVASAWNPAGGGVIGSDGGAGMIGGDGRVKVKVTAMMGRAVVDIGKAGRFGWGLPIGCIGFPPMGKFG